jgi:HSP20 family protein
MRLLPRTFDDLFYNMNDAFDDFFDDSFVEPRNDTMLCDVRENDNDYEMIMSMPGVDKNDIKIDLNNGYLNIAAQTHNNHDEKDDEGHLIRQERYAGQVARSFYVGDDVKPEDVKASFDNGELHLHLPKNNNQIENNDHYIAIE